MKCLHNDAFHFVCTIYNLYIYIYIYKYTLCTIKRQIGTQAINEVISTVYTCVYVKVSPISKLILMYAVYMCDFPRTCHCVTHLYYSTYVCNCNRVQKEKCEFTILR